MKTCPRCNESHEKSGTFCSRHCANSRGPRSDDFKMKVRNKLIGRQSPFKGIFKTERATSKCFVCFVEINVSLHDVNKNKTCGSSDCIKQLKSIMGKKSAAKRVKRSKDEILLYEMCANYFNNVENNEIVADGWDADIILREQKTVIFWNGPWHYKNMGMKNHSLKQVQNRDKIKTELFESLGWKVLSFNDNEYTPVLAFKKMVEMLGTAPSSDCYEQPASL